MLKKILFVVFACVSIIGVTSGANALTVSYDCGTSNGTAPTDSTNYNSGDVVTVKPNSCDVPSGKHFAGYICGSTNVAAGNTFIISSNTTCTAQYENGKFAVKTNSTTTVLKFSMTAVGTFTVDCGDGGVLSDDAATTTVSGNTITRSNTTLVTYTCTWASAGAHTVSFDGTGTEYSTAEVVNELTDIASSAAISFDSGASSFDKEENAKKLISISGNLYSLFPSTGTDVGQIPRFYRAFYRARNLTSISSTLFNGYTKASKYMFSTVFAGCTSLTSIPSGLFSTLTTGSSHVFHAVFAGCTSLTSIPSDLFASLTVGENQMFRYSFESCTGLQSIPDNLFASFTTGATSMFLHTFAGCTGLQSLPANLFSHFTVGYSYMFNETFQNCTSLTSIPANLFANITTGSNYTFKETFSGCTNLSGYVPSSLFAGLIANNATYETDMMKNIFYNTGLDTSCPNGTTRYETPYDEYWDGHVSCVNVITINWNGATAAAIAANNAGTAVYGGDIRTPQSYDPSQVPVGKRFVGWKFRKPFNLSTYLSEPYNNANSAGSGYISNDGSNSYNTSTYDLTVDGTWGVTLANNFGSVRGESRCSDTDNGNSNTHIGNPGNATTGKYCWCKATNYRAYNDTLWQNVLVVPWVFYGDYGSPTSCATGCGEACAYGGRQKPNFRTLLLSLQ